jgi:hypothetical protein
MLVGTLGFLGRDERRLFLTPEYSLLAGQCLVDTAEGDTVAGANDARRAIVVFIVVAIVFFVAARFVAAYEGCEVCVCAAIAGTRSSAAAVSPTLAGHLGPFGGGRGRGRSLETLGAVETIKRSEDFVL